MRVALACLLVATGAAGQGLDKVRLCDKTNATRCAAVAADGSVTVSGSLSVGGAADTVGSAVAFNANGICAFVATAGQTGVGFAIAAGTLTGTLTPSVSTDSTNGTNGTWTATSFVDISGNTTSTQALTNPNSAFTAGVVLLAGGRYARVCTTAFTSGTATGFLVASTPQPRPPAAGADVTDRAGRLVGVVSAASLPLPTGAATAAKQPALGTAGTPSADVITVQGVTSMTALKVDGSATTQPVSGTVAATQSGTWTVQPGNTANTTAWKVDGSAVTQPVSGTVNAAQSGTWNITNVSGTVSLPTGAATEASLAKLTQTQGSTTSGQSGPLIQGAVTTSAPTYTNGQTSPLSLDTTGALRVAGSFSSSGASDTAGTLVTLSAACATGTSCGANTTAQVALAGQQSFSVTFSSPSSPVMTVVADCSFDGGTTWALTGSPASTGVVWFETAVGVFSQSVANPAATGYTLQNLCGGATHLRVRVGAFTSGSVAAQLRATFAPPPDPTFAGAIGANSYPQTAVAMLAQDSTTATTSRAVLGDASSNLLVGIRNGTTQAAVKAASTAAAATDPALVVAVSPNNTIPQNQTQINGVAVSTGNGVAGTGVQRVTIASDNTANSNPWLVAGAAANGATSAGNPVRIGGIGRATGAAPTQVTAGQASDLTTDLEHRLWVTGEHPNRFSCTVDAASASTQCVGLSGASLSYYLTSVTFSASAAITFKVNSSTTAGNACATSPALVIPTTYFAANTGGHMVFPQAIKVTANSALCCQPSGASGSCVLSGYIAP